LFFVFWKSGASKRPRGAKAAGTLATATAGVGGGWIYRPTTGEIWIDNTNYVTW